MRHAEARTLDLQAFDNSAVEQVFLDDLVDIPLIHIGVPDAFGVNHDHGAFLATVQTPRRVYPHAAPAGDTQLFAAPFGMITHRQCVEALATGAAIGTLVGTEKDVIAIVVHGQKDTASARPCIARDRTQTPESW